MRRNLVYQYGQDPETGSEAVKLVVYLEHRFSARNYFVFRKFEDDVTACKALLDDLRVTERFII